jgi:colanic acid biosynthesis glycosyl transferase WcaI
VRILFFTQYFWPENFRINELVKFFSKKKNIVLTTYPSYPQKKKFRKKINLKNLPFYKNCEIKRVPVYLRSNTNLSIILNYISFFFSSLTIGFFKILKKNFDVIFVFSPSPILNAIPAIIFKKILKKKIIIWVLDLWPDTLIDLKLVNNKFIIWIMRSLVIYIYDNSDLILAQSNYMKNAIGKLTKSKCIYFPSWPEEINKDKKKVKEIKKTNKVKLLFAGNIGESQSFETMIKCAKLLKKMNIIEWIVVGDGRWKKKLEFLIRTNKLENEFQLLDSVPLNKINNYFNCADALFLSLKNNQTFKKTIPGKLQTYMITGKPIIASISGETKKIIIKAKCGYASNAENYKLLKNNIIKFTKLNYKKRKKLGTNGKNFCNKFFSKKKTIKNLENEINLMFS